MRSTYQHKIIAHHLQSCFGHREYWPYSAASEIEKELCREELSLSPGEYLVVSLADEGGPLGKVGDFRGLAMYPRASLVISYHELERVFNEQHAEWIEL
jgi:hypothetical protein